MALPLDNMFFQYFLRFWPIILAIIITVLLVYKIIRPKIDPEKLYRGLINQSILLTLEEDAQLEEDRVQREWLETRLQIEKRFGNRSGSPQSTQQQIDYRAHVTVSLIWTLFWIGVDAFLIIRICASPYYYGNEAVFLGCFTYYIIIGLISYFWR